MKVLKDPDEIKLQLHEESTCNYSTITQQYHVVLSW